MPPLLICSILSPLIPLLAGFRKRTTLLWIYPLVALFSDLLITFLKRGIEVNSKWPANIFVLLEFLLVSFIYRNKIFRNSKIFFGFIGGLSLFFIVDTLSESIFVFNKSGSGFFAFTYIIYGIIGYYSILKQQKVIFLDKYWFFWLNTAFLVYASGSFLIFLFRNHLLIEDSELFQVLWSYLFLSLNIVKNILLGIAIYHYGRHQQ